MPFSHLAPVSHLQQSIRPSSQARRSRRARWMAKSTRRTGQARSGAHGAYILLFIETESDLNESFYPQEPHQMPAHAKNSPSYLFPLILALILVLVPLALSSAQAGSDQSVSLEAEGGASNTDAGAEAHEKGKGCGGWCNHGSASGGRGGKGHGCGGGQRGTKGAGQKGHGRPEMQNAHFLVTNHDRLERAVEEIPNGVQTVTTTDDPELVEPLRKHVQEMSAVLAEGGHVRKWDPLFAEISEHGEAIQIEIEEIDDGVRVTETSEDEEVVKLIRAHARKIDQFLARGPEACREETPLPSDYAGR